MTKNTFTHTMLAASLLAGGSITPTDTAHAQNIAGYSGIAVDKSFHKSLKELAQSVYSTTGANENAMKKLVAFARSNHERVIKKEEEAGMSPRDIAMYSIVATPVELGKDLAIVVNPVNETLVVFDNIKMEPSGAIDLDNAKAIKVYWDPKLTKIYTDETERTNIIISSAKNAVVAANGLLEQTFSKRIEAAKGKER